MQDYQRTRMQKNHIIQKLKEQGCRITKQRQLLLDIILEEDCSCCKEIYYRASKKNSRIGAATVYRMINTLEDIGAIERNNMYKIACGEECHVEEACTIQLDDESVVELSARQWHQIIQTGMEACGYMRGQNIKNVVAKSCVSHQVSEEAVNGRFYQCVEA